MNYGKYIVFPFKFKGIIAWFLSKIATQKKDKINNIREAIKELESLKIEMHNIRKNYVKDKQEEHPIINRPRRIAQRLNQLENDITVAINNGLDTVIFHVDKETYDSINNKYIQYTALRKNINNDQSDAIQGQLVNYYLKVIIDQIKKYKQIEKDLIFN